MGDHIFKDEETPFRDWLRSVAFVKKDGTLLPLELKDDISPDPEGDREEDS